MTRTLLITMLSVFVLIGISCGGGPQNKSAADLLPTELSGAGATRSSEVQVYAGNALSQYLDNAELYQSFGFIEAATADYQAGDAELCVDVYRFDSPANAKALFDEIRPAGAEPLTLGAEGVASLGNILLVKGNFVVSIDAYDESQATYIKLAKAAAAMGLLLPN